jgi:Tol biopolymer transport system component
MTRRIFFVAMIAALTALSLIGCGGGGSGDTQASDPGRLLVVRDDGGNKDIYTLSTDGTIVNRLTTDSAVDNEPRWSPDQKKIVFVREKSSVLESVFVMDANGSNAIELTPGENAFDPRWLPNGKIVYASGVGSASEIYMMNADGSNKTRLTTDAIGDICPEVSPDGLTIAYMKNISGTHQIYFMSPGGTNQRALIGSGGVAIGSLAFSKDSTQLAYVTSRDGNKEVYLINTDGTNERRLTNNSADDFSVNWSPDGSKLLFASLRDGSAELYTMNPDGTSQTRITNNSVLDIPFGWR